MDGTRILVFDTTLRDGEQSPGCSMNVQEKLRMARQLEELGVDIIEAGFPIASQGDFAAVQAVAASIRRPVIAGLARASTQDIERACQALCGAARPRIHVFLATSDLHLQYKLRITRDQCLQQIEIAIRLAKSLCDDIEFSPEDATRSDPDFLCRALDVAVEAGATTLNIPDTVGYSMPSEFAQLVERICARVPDHVIVSVHCHNDLGLAVANSLAALEAGARQVECTINGIGERAGNASLEEIIMATRVRHDRFPYETAVVTEQLYPASQLLSEITGVPVQPNKAIIGRNAFAHEAGIHQDGVLKNPLTYEIMTPQSVGVPDSTLVLGKHSGRHALAQRYQRLGYEFERRELDEIYRLFVALADRFKRIEDDHLLELVREARGEQSSSAVSIQPQVLAMAAASGRNGSRSSQVGARAAQPEIPIPLSSLAEHHCEAEDYLWGV